MVYRDPNPLLQAEIEENPLVGELLSSPEVDALRQSYHAEGRLTDEEEKRALDPIISFRLGLLEAQGRRTS